MSVPFMMIRPMRRCVGATAIAVLALAPTAVAASPPGTVFGFGLNNRGQLGTSTNNGTGNPNPAPTPVPSLSATALAAGSGFSLAITPDGQLESFGVNSNGQLGNTTNLGFNSANPTPSSVTLPAGAGSAVAVAAGEKFGLVATSSGQLYGFGDNSYGQLGLAPDTSAHATPTLINLPGASGGVTAVSAGDVFSLALTGTGQVYAFGSNLFGQTGPGATTLYSSNSPQLITLPGATGPAVAVAAGYESSYALTSTGQLYSWGHDNYGQTGHPLTADNPNTTPALVTLPGASGPVVQIAAGDYHALALTSTGQLYSFGLNRYDELDRPDNVGTMNGNATPALATVSGATAPIKTITANFDTTLVTTTDGRLFASGWNLYGELGTSSNTSTYNANGPAEVAFDPGTYIVGAAAGPTAEHSLALTGSPPPDPTTTTLTCAPATVQAGGTTLCTATVTDTGSIPTVPTGAVTFGADGNGAFDAPSCTLTPRDSTSASCAVQYSPETVGSGSRTVTASYNGDTGHTTSSGSGGLDVTASPQPAPAPAPAPAAAPAAAPPPAPPLAKPTAITGPAARITPLHSDVRGTVNPNGEPTTVRFRWGRTTSYGSATSGRPAFAGQGTSSLSVEATLGSLRPATTYHYQLVAISRAGASYGADRTLLTPAACRDRLGPVSRFAPSGTRIGRDGIDLAGRSWDRGGCRSDVIDPRDRGGVRRVRVAIELQRDGRCRPLLADLRFGLAQSCTIRAYQFTVVGTTRWSLQLRLRLPRGRYRCFAVAVDPRGNREPFDPLERNGIFISLP